MTSDEYLKVLFEEAKTRLNDSAFPAEIVALALVHAARLLAERDEQIEELTYEKRIKDLYNE